MTTPDTSAPRPATASRTGPVTPSRAAPASTPPTGPCRTLPASAADVPFTPVPAARTTRTSTADAPPTAVPTPAPPTAPCRTPQTAPPKAPFTPTTRALPTGVPSTPTPTSRTTPHRTAQASTTGLPSPTPALTAITLLTVTTALTLALTSCSTITPPDDGKGGAPARARIAISAPDGSTRASINATGVKVGSGRLTDVTMTQVADGAEVAGRISADGGSWKPAGQLERGTTYRVSAWARGTNGRAVAASSVFTTVSVADSFIGSYMPDGGTTVGVGMPVSFTFDKVITRRAEVERRIRVSSSSGQRVVGHWFGAQRLDFRPQRYWKAGSKVTVRIDLDGVEGADGLFGVQDKTVGFTVGRSQVSTVDVGTQTMTVVRDGRVLRTVPISSGSAQNPTYNGQLVVSEKSERTRMDGDSVGFGGEYDIPDVPHAMRLSTSGTFIHGNYWYDPVDPPFGREGSSHGCVGLRDIRGGGGDTDGKWFFDHSLIGDVVNVQGSPDRTVAPDNGLNGWNMSWRDWVAGSALATASAAD